MLASVSRWRILDELRGEGVYQAFVRHTMAGHIQILRGQFILKVNPDGSTRLIGKSWYRLRVYPAWYYGLWAEDITRQVHLRVMKHIKRLAENDV